MADRNRMLAIVKQAEDGMQKMLEDHTESIELFTRPAFPAPHHIKAYLAFGLSRHYALRDLSSA